MDSEITPKTPSKLDGVYKIDNGNTVTYLNIEPQGYRDPALPARILRYRADIWEYTALKEEGFPPIKQLVVFYLPSHEKNPPRLQDDQGESHIDFQYDVIRLWEMKKTKVIENRWIGLYPLMIFMEREPNETPDQIMQVALDAIETVEDESLREDLLAITALMASERFTKAFAKKFIGRELIMKSSLLEEWVEERLEFEKQKIAEKAAKEASIDTSINAIKELLEERYVLVSVAIEEKLRKIASTSALSVLHRKVYKTDTLEEFENLIDQALKNQ